MWFDLCAEYLNRLELIDAYFHVYDDMPTETKQEKEDKRDWFAGLMNTMKQKKAIEKDLDKIWGTSLLKI